MNNNTHNSISDIKPLIFTKKINDNHKIIPLNTKSAVYAPAKHFPAATKEWFNSVYAYNKNSIKNLSVADRYLSKLIKGYFNLYFSKGVFKSRHISKRFRRLSLNKIFVSKAELKHTSNKLIITIYIYNEERRLLINKLKRLETLLFSSKSYSFNSFDKKIPLSINNKISFISKQKESLPLINYLDELQSNIKFKLELEQNKLINGTSLNKEKLLFIENLESSLDNLTETIALCKIDKDTYDKCDRLYEEIIRKLYLEKEIAAISYYKLLLNLNRSKFEDKFLLKLKPLISKIYNKKIEFNIVNLKTLYFNSDIFTQAIATKLKNRDNSLLRVLNNSLHMVKLPNVNSIRDKYGSDDIYQTWINKRGSLSINTMFDENNVKQDVLNKFLQDMYSTSNPSLIKEAKRQRILISSLNNPVNVNLKRTTQEIIFNSLKYKRMAGVRLEAKGRLTRRFTASRSVFKVKWKGGLKNIDSSYREQSTVILRGHVKSNLQYSVINSKTRNGSFGLKGWISSK